MYDPSLDGRGPKARQDVGAEVGVVVSAGGGAPSLGGDPLSAILGIVVLLIVVGFVVWKLA